MDLPCGIGYAVDGPSQNSTAVSSVLCHQNAGFIYMGRALSRGLVTAEILDMEHEEHSLVSALSIYFC